MSYARWGPESEVYVFADVAGGVVCCGCSLDDSVNEEDFTDFFGMVHKKGDRKMFGDTLRFFGVDSLIEHFHAHRQAGHTVPSYLLDAATYDDEDFEDRGP